ncbi:molybdenum cofactor biosynthesis prote, partial [Gonapodya prolifera JEL478]
LVDRFDRRHRYLRVSLTERCNLRCTYCMPPEGAPLSPQPSLLTTPELLTLCRLFISHGVDKIRLTGGEPTLRKDMLDVVRALDAMRKEGLGLNEIVMTTNGIAGARKVAGWKEAGLDGVNLSLDALDEEGFERVARRRGLSSVLATLDALLAHSIRVKLNVVVLRSVNLSHLVSFIREFALGERWCGQHKIPVRFIELMPFGGNGWERTEMVSYREMRDVLENEFGQLVEVEGNGGGEVAKTFHLPSDPSTRLGFITSMTSHFCPTCDRLRLTADGHVKACLHSGRELDLRGALRDPSLGAEEAERRIMGVVGKAVWEKEAGHKGAGELARGGNRPMVLIGGSAKVSTAVEEEPALVASSTPTGIQPSTTQTLPSSASPPDSATLTHLTSSGALHMVDVLSKPPTLRHASARCSLYLSAHAARLLRKGALAKGDAVAVAKVAGTAAAKRTWDVVPMCHMVNIGRVDVEVVIPDVPEEGEEGGATDYLPESSRISDSRAAEYNYTLPRRVPRFPIHVSCSVTALDRTGCEMEAVHGCSVAAVVLYDMCKAADRGAVISGVRVVEKSGGKSGGWRGE